MEKVEVLFGKIQIAFEPKRIAEGVTTGKGRYAAGNTGDSWFISACLWVVRSKKVDFMTQLGQASVKTIDTDADPIENGEG